MLLNTEPSLQPPDSDSNPTQGYKEAAFSPLHFCGKVSGSRQLRSFLPFAKPCSSIIT